MHCKWRAGKNPTCGSQLCIPRNETVQPPYFQNRIIMFCLKMPTFIYQWEIYTVYCQDQSVFFTVAKYVDRFWEYINLSHTHKCGNWDWGSAIPRKGIHKWDFRCSVMQQYTLQYPRRFLNTCFSTPFSILCHVQCVLSLRWIIALDITVLLTFYKLNSCSWLVLHIPVLQCHLKKSTEQSYSGFVNSLSSIELNNDKCSAHTFTSIVTELCCDLI